MITTKLLISNNFISLPKHRNAWHKKILFIFIDIFYYSKSVSRANLSRQTSFQVSDRVFYVSPVHDAGSLSCKNKKGLYHSFVYLTRFLLQIGILMYVHVSVWHLLCVFYGEHPSQITRSFKTVFWFVLSTFAFQINKKTYMTFWEQRYINR